MHLRRFSRSFVRWFLTILTVVLVVAILYSSRRYVSWISSDLRRAYSLGLGALHIGWRPDGWDVSAEGHPPNSGWTVGRCGGQKLWWWFDRSESKSWHGIAIPLWMPGLLAGMSAGLAWYLDRALLLARYRRWIVWLTPRRPKRLGFWKVAGFSLLHVLVLFVLAALFGILYDFFVAYQREDPVRTIVEFALVSLFWTTPAWGLLWAWIYVRRLNALFRRQAGNRCLGCGYDLTGNVSGRCSECGREIADVSMVAE